jgi:mgtE-like transporter
VKKEESILHWTERELKAIAKPKVPKRTYREFGEIFVSEMISVTGGIFAGTMLALAVDKLALIPGILILMPGFLEMRGNIAGSLAARLSTSLHLKLLNGKKGSRIKTSNVWAAFLLGILVSAFLGFVAYVGTLLFFKINYPKIMIVALAAGIVSNLIMIPITTKTTIWLYRHGHDPDNIMGPYITTLGDIVSVASLLLGIWLV